MILTPEDFECNTKNPKQILKQIVLGLPNCAEIVDTERWEKGNELELKLVANGIEITDTDLLSTLTKWHEVIEKYFIGKYENVEKEISKRVQIATQNVLRDVIEPYREKLESVTQSLDNIGYITELYEASNVVAEEDSNKEFILAMLKSKYEYDDETTFTFQNVVTTKDTSIYTVIVKEKNCKEDWVKVTVSSKYM